MADFDHRKAKGGRKGETVIVGKDGSQEAVREYEQISIGHGSYHLGRLPYIAKISEIRGVNYCSGNFCARKA